MIASQVVLYFICNLAKLATLPGIPAIYLAPKKWSKAPKPDENMYGSSMHKTWLPVIVQFDKLFQVAFLFYIHLEKYF